MSESTDRKDTEDVGADFVEPGKEFTRDTNYITTRITADGRDGYPVEPGRYRLIVARACPWANRVDHRAPSARPRRRSVDGHLRADPRRTQLDVRSRSRRGRPGAEDPPTAGRVLRPRSPDTRAGSRCRRSSRSRPGRSSPTTSRRSPSTSPPSGRNTTARGHRTCIRRTCATRSTRCPNWCSTTSTTASTAAVSPAHRRRTTTRTTVCSSASTG